MEAATPPSSALTPEPENESADVAASLSMPNDVRPQVASNSAAPESTTLQKFPRNLLVDAREVARRLR